MMWFFLLLHIAHSEPAQGHVNRLILKNGRNPCEGHAELYHNGQWGYIGDAYWSNNTEVVVCKSTHCGKRENSTKHVLRPSSSKVWLNEVNCSGTESHLWDCTHPGWGISHYQKDSVRWIKCSNTIKITLDGFKCAGVVRYSTDGNTPSGYFCGDNWGQNESKVLCASLKCGETGDLDQHEWVAWGGFDASKKMTLSCLDPDSVTNLWQCAPQEAQSCRKPASVICSDYERLQLRSNTTNVCSGRLEIKKIGTGIWTPFESGDLSPDVWCRQVHCGTHVNVNNVSSIQLTCTDRVEVVLMDNGNTSICYGTVYIKVNGSSHPVCASNWIRQNTEVLCNELNCGKAINEEKKNASRGIMDNVKCSGEESSLWHCQAKRDNKPFQCQSNAYVMCAASVKVRLADGPGKCAGRVEIQHEDRWKRVSKEGWTDTNSDVVCKQLKCGSKRSSANPEKFSQGSGDFLSMNVNCSSSFSNISECISGNNLNIGKEAVGITCEEHKVLFLEGNISCSGMVGIEHGDKTYWLSGSNQTWDKKLADMVCRQSHCGKALSFSSSRCSNVKKEDVSYGCLQLTAYKCSHNAMSLFQCENKSVTSNNSDPIVATVNCSVKIEVNLTNDCWGNVNICIGGKCGGVCNDTWTDEKAKMLCKSLGCGDAVLRSIHRPNKIKAILKSLHLTKRTTNLTQCNLVENGDNNHNCDPAHVVCSGSAKIRINATREKCTGNVQVYYGGQWLPVCTEALKDAKTRDIICGEKCGQAVKTVDYFGLLEARDHVSDLQCPANGESFMACNITLNQQPCALVGLQCAGWSRMELKFYKEACSGALFVHSKAPPRSERTELVSAVFSEGWTAAEGMRLCRDLNCGIYSSSEVVELNQTLDSFWNSSFSCTGVEETIWNCEKQTPPSQKQHLIIKCQDEPKVALSEKCGGELTVNETGVCDSQWSMNYSHMVCQQLECSNALSNFSDKMPNSNEEYYHIRCEPYHHNLGQCERFRAKCNGKLVSVYCTRNVKFSTTEECQGQIKVKYRNDWEKVHVQKSLPTKFVEKLCKELNCSSHEHNISITDGKEKVTLGTTLSCTEENTDIRHCVFQNSSQDLSTSEISCKKNNLKPTRPPKTSVVPIILGVGFLLLLVALIIVLLPVYIVTKVTNVSSNMLPREEVEFESGQYEDVMGKASEVEDLARGRFRSEAEVITESDGRSISSFPYDDIEAGEARSLTSQAATAGASGDNYIPEEAFSHSADGVTYEVDDPQESYDDIEACPEVTRAQAEVHSSPRTTPESVAVTPPGLMPRGGGDDYLVPGQDG